MALTEAAFKSAFKSQYHAALAMLKEAVELCPEEIWQGTDDVNQFWQIAYHTVFFTHLYVHQNEAAFHPWAQHQAGNQNPDGIAGEPDPKSSLPLIPEPYTKAQVLEYWGFCDGMIDEAVDKLDLEQPESGFHWARMSKLQHQFVNLRHIQHHTGQLADRVRAAANVGVRWVGRWPRAQSSAVL
jgi:hypothetical protein